MPRLHVKACEPCGPITSTCPVTPVTEPPTARSNRRTAGGTTGEIARKYQLSPKLLERWGGEWRAKSMKGFEDNAPGPEVVATAVSKILASDSPPLRKKVTFQTTLLTSLLQILPEASFEAVMRLIFKLDRD